MSVFKNSNGDEFRIQLDGFVLDEVRKATGVDLADLSAGGWWTIETDAGALARVLAIVCQDEIKARKMDQRTFARLIRWNAIVHARAALVEEGADFFPQSEWSAIRANWAKRKTNQTATNEMEAVRPMLGMIAMLPKEMQAGAAEALKEAILKSGGDNTTSPDSESEPSATGPGAILSNSVTDSLESAELTAVG